MMMLVSRAMTYLSTTCGPRQRAVFVLWLSNRAPVENLITMFWVLCTITMKKKKQKNNETVFCL